MMDEAVKRYNDIMFDLGREYNTIGTNYTEDPEHRNKWNLRDLVSEMQYTLDVHLDPGCTPYIDAHSGDKDDYKVWASETGKMKRFIKKYADSVAGMKCTEGHCSCFD